MVIAHWGLHIWRSRSYVLPLGYVVKRGNDALNVIYVLTRSFSYDASVPCQTSDIEAGGISLCSYKV